MKDQKRRIAMQPLKHVISALQREIYAALEENNPLPAGARFEAERIVLALEFSISEQRTDHGGVALAFAVIENAADARNSPRHTVTIELKPIRSAPTGPLSRAHSESISAKGPGALEGAEAEQATKSLSDVFGAPGFDSSARATVFREAIERLSDDQLLAVIASLNGAPIAEPDAPAKRARHLVTRILTSGPLKSVARGGEVLAHLFQRHSVGSIIRLIEHTWKSQDDWLA